MLEKRLSSGFSRAIYIYICGCPLNCGLVEHNIYIYIYLFAIKLVLV